jgi:catechol 2,3-dioxygenase-like lactoylglutathione lyase family enzyme
MRIDHVIYATADLDLASALVEDELGLPVRGGGRHEGVGTHNRIVPLGGGYLELLAIADPEAAAATELGRMLQELIERHGEGLLGWAVAVDDVEPIAERLDLAISTVTRQGLSARLTGVAEALREPLLPFFIARDSAATRRGAAGDAGAITWLEVSGDAARLEAWLGGAQLPVRVVEGPPAVRAVGIGEREFRPAPGPRRAA